MRVELFSIEICFVFEVQKEMKALSYLVCIALIRIDNNVFMVKRDKSYSEMALTVRRGKLFASQ